MYVCICVLVLINLEFSDNFLKLIYGIEYPIVYMSFI